MIEKVEWDSGFFERKIGRVNIIDESAFDTLNFISYANNFDLIYIQSFGKMLSNSFIAKTNIELVDIMITMSFKFDKNEYKNQLYNNYNNLPKSELNKCYSIAEETSEVSRFYDEKLIGAQKTKDLYRKWIDNTINRSFCDGFFVERIGGEVVGLHLIKVDKISNVGYFMLTGVDGNFKKQGIGRKLWYQSFGFFANETSIKTIKSNFSFKNKDSFNFHLKLGFHEIEEIKYIYHYRKTMLNDTI